MLGLVVVVVADRVVSFYTHHLSLYVFDEILFDDSSLSIFMLFYCFRNAALLLLEMKRFLVFREELITLCRPFLIEELQTTLVY